LVIRIGTWNLEGKSTTHHTEFLERSACDIWLLTEVPPSLQLASGTIAFSADMGPRKAWAAVWARNGLTSLPSIHPAACLADVGNVRVCSCILPWRGGRPNWPDEGPDIASITAIALDRLRQPLSLHNGDLVWGGDWNHAFHAAEVAGTQAGRETLTHLIRDLRLHVPTSRMAHTDSARFSIDHIGVPDRWRVHSASRIVATSQGRRLSDHDAYVIDVDA
jgi:hypothetical protein